MRCNTGKVVNRIACILCFLVGGAGASCTSPSASSCTENARGIFNVADFGAIANDLTADNTAAFQNALDSAGKQGGGMVMVPLGRYAFHGTLTLPANVVLSGATPGPYDPAGMPAGHSPADTPVGASVLLVMQNSSRPFISVPGYNSAIMNLLFYYPNQVQPDSPGVDQAGPTPYPPTVRTNGVFRISGCSFTNSYIAVDVHGGRTWIDHLNIGAYKVGISVDDTADFTRISHVLIHPFFDSWAGCPRFPQPIDKWVFNNGHGIDLLRVDGITIDDYSTFFRSVGLFLTKGRQGVTFGNATNLQFDMVQYGILANGTNTAVGFSVTNGYIDAAGPPTTTRLGIASQAAICLQHPFPNSRSLIAITGLSINGAGFVHPIMVAPGGGTLRFLNSVMGPPDYQVITH